MPARGTKRSLPDPPVIATRELEVAGRRRKAVVTLWQPVQVDDEQWTCAYRITGMRKPGRGIGGDAFQALTVALQGIQVHLDRTPGRYTWLGGEHFFAQMLPMGFGRRWQRHIGRIVDRELTAYVRAEVKKRRERRRRRRRKDE